MTVNGATKAGDAGSDSAVRIKRVAQRLFAERGIRNVTIREIARAAGQKNVGAVGYYFGSKENLVAEVLIDGARLIEERRKAHLERLEASGGPVTVREALETLVLPSTEFSKDEVEAANHFNRFLLLLSLSEGDFIDRTLVGRWNSGYQRSLAHLRRLMPDMPLAAKNRRFVFLGAYLGSLLAMRESMLNDPKPDHPGWRSDATLEDILRTATALLEAPY